jgi:hypothetical protein
MTRRNVRKQGWVFPVIFSRIRWTIEPKFHRFVILISVVIHELWALGQYCLPKVSYGFKVSLGGSFGYPVLPGSKLKTGPAVPLFCGTGYPLLSVPILKDRVPTIKGSVEPILRRTGSRNWGLMLKAVTADTVCKGFKPTWVSTITCGCIHSAQPPPMHRHLYMYISCIYMYMYRVQSPNRQHVVIGCRYIHIHKSLSHAQNTQYCMHVQACTLVCTETTHCMHYGRTALRTYCYTTDVLPAKSKTWLNAGRIGARWHDVWLTWGGYSGIFV